MYKLLNQLLGWDYVCYRYGSDDSIRKVFILPDDRPAFWVYGTLVIITKADQVTWLTCKPDKYLDNSEVPR